MDTLINTIIEPEARDAWGQYPILPGHTHIFPFTLPMLNGIKISCAHILPNTQDFSMLMWISAKPLDDIMLEEGFGRFRPIRRTTEVEIFDIFLKRDSEDDRNFLFSNRTYYLNVKNLQNSKNGYQLTFENLT